MGRLTIVLVITCLAWPPPILSQTDLVHVLVNNGTCWLIIFQYSSQLIKNN